MTFSDFTLTSAETLLGLNVIPGDLFPGRPPETVPAWLTDQLRRGRRFVLTSEKARSEFLVVPVLSAACEISGDAMTIYSGERLDVDPTFGLSGVCDFILSVTPAVPRLKAPLAVILEAKKNDIELGLGQCVSQMVAAARFNESAGVTHDVFGCVTTGEVWQFLRMHGTEIQIDRERYYIDNLPGLLSVFQGIAETCLAAA